MPEPSPQPRALTADDVAGAEPGAPVPPDDDGPAAPSPGPREVTASVSVLVTLVLLTVMVFLRVPYAVTSPGPTWDTLGEQDGTPLISVEGAPTYPSTGQLRLTTVRAAGGPGFPATLPQTVAAWLSDRRVVRPVEVVYPPDVTREQIAEQNQASMTSSQESATVAALEELGYEVPASLHVAGTVEGSGAVGVVETGDVLVSFEGAPVTSYGELVATLAVTAPGTTVDLGVVRDGEPVDLEVVTGERTDGGSQLGVFIDPRFRFPVEVDITIEEIGGPSAGMMFALGIVDRLTPEDETAGEVVAGTGTIDVNGQVGRISGIRQKLVGADRDGASWFLAPAANCDEVVGHVPDGLGVVRVETLADARRAVEAIGAGATGDLPTCTVG